MERHRTCNYCNAILSQRPDEQKYAFAKRTHCNASCANSKQAQGGDELVWCKADDLPEGTHGPTREDWILEQGRIVRELNIAPTANLHRDVDEPVETLVLPDPKGGK